MIQTSLCLTPVLFLENNAIPKVNYNIFYTGRQGFRQYALGSFYPVWLLRTKMVLVLKVDKAQFIGRFILKRSSFLIQNKA